LFDFKDRVRALVTNPRQVNDTAKINLMQVKLMYFGADDAMIR